MLLNIIRTSDEVDVSGLGVCTGREGRRDSYCLSAKAEEVVDDCVFDIIRDVDSDAGKGDDKGQGQTKALLKKRGPKNQEYNKVYHSAYATAMQEGTPMRGPSPVPS